MIVPVSIRHNLGQETEQGNLYANDQQKDTKEQQRSISKPPVPQDPPADEIEVDREPSDERG